MNYRDIALQWTGPEYDEQTRMKVNAMLHGNPKELEDAFYRNLEFGTGGLRGIMGVGINRMNKYTVGMATQGFSNYIKKAFPEGGVKVAVSYDSRNNSKDFAKITAEVFAANGFHVYLFENIRPTPVLSFAIRELKCQAGVMVTASHNPKEYNGYKAYWSDGAQITAPHDTGIIEEVMKITNPSMVNFSRDGFSKIELIGENIDRKYLDSIHSLMLSPESVKRHANIKLVYTPLHGTGNIPVRKILEGKNITVVKEQELPDGNFPTCPYPNPEIRQAFEEAIKLANEIGGDLLLATDPDCDRVGIAVNDGGEYKLMTGNEVGVLLAQYLLSCKKENGTLPEKPAIIKTIVTTNLISAVAEKYNCEIYDLLTGFKYIGELVTELEAKGEVDRYILGMEESYGYLTGIHARDKDAVNGASLICEMAAYYKATCGKNLYQIMQDIYDEYGMYMNTLLNFAFAGAEGMDKMKAIMTELRENPPKEIAGMKVTKVSDYLNSVAVDTETGEKTVLTLPKSNVLAYALPGGNGAIIRPSGTEPKIKIYITAVGKDREAAQALTDEISADMKGFVGVE